MEDERGVIIDDLKKEIAALRHLLKLHEKDGKKYLDMIGELKAENENLKIKLRKCEGQKKS